MTRNITHWINGKPWDGAHSGQYAQRYGEVFDPSTGQVSATVAFASAEDVDSAVTSAAAAFPGWRDTSLAKRTSILFAFRELIVRHTDELAALISSEHGKVASDAA